VTGGEECALALVLRGEAQLLANGRRLDRWAISVSHGGGLAIGFVIATQSTKPGHIESGEEEADG
jgi:hypothetical protein